MKSKKGKIRKAKAAKPGSLFHFLFLVFHSAFLLVACQTSPQTQPKSPVESYRTTTRTVSAERYLSTINVPVEITTAELTRQVNARLQGLLYEDDSLETDDFACKVWKRAPIRVEAVTDTFHLHVPLKIWAKFGYGFRPLGLNLSTYKDTDFEVDMHFIISFRIQPDWTIQTQTQVKGFDWVSKPVLRLGPVNLPISTIVGKIVNTNRDAITKGIDEAVRKNVVVRPYVIQAWNSALQPYLLSEKYRTWLKLTPTELFMTPLRASGDRVRATIGIRAVTQTLFGERPVVRPVSDVPDLKTVAQVTDDFRVGLVAQLSYPEARRLLNDTLAGKTFDFAEGRYRVSVTEVDVYGSEDRLILKVGLRGSLNGTVYFRGVPFYDPTEKTIELRDLQYDLDTRSVLARTASWLLQGKFTRQLQAVFRFPMSDQLAAAQREVQAALRNRPVARGVRLDGTLRGIQPEGVYLTPEFLMAVVFAEGKLTLHVDGL